MAKSEVGGNGAKMGCEIPPQYIFDLILEIARQVRGSGMGDLEAIHISKGIIQQLSHDHCGESFYFGDKSIDYFKTLIAAQLEQYPSFNGDVNRVSELVAKKVNFAYKHTFIYVPKGKKQIRERNVIIVNEYLSSPSLRTVRAIAKKHGITQRMVYLILARKGGLTLKKDVTERNKGIVAEYNKNPCWATISDLATKHGLSKSRVYFIATGKSYKSKVPVQESDLDQSVEKN